MEMQQILEMLIEMKADRKAYLEKADAGQAEIIAAIEKKTDAWIAKIKDARKKDDRLPISDEGQSREDGAKFGRRGNRIGATRDS
jgi:hypothetical protein